MKTKNNVWKAILRWAAVAVSFVLISLTVSAQDFWKRLLENSSFNEIAIAMTGSSDNGETYAAPTESFWGAYLENEVEPMMELEDWMTDDSNFNTTVFRYTEDTDEEPVLESWMFDEALFQPADETEPLLQMEEWMTAETVWGI